MKNKETSIAIEEFNKKLDKFMEENAISSMDNEMGEEEPEEEVEYDFWSK